MHRSTSKRLNRLQNIREKYSALHIHDYISCLDLETGNIQERVITWPSGSRAAISMDFLDSDNMLLVLRRVGQQFEDINTIDPDGDGIHLFRFEDFSQRQFFRGRYEYFPTASEEYHCCGGV
jgi:hypothetical protein